MKIFSILTICGMIVRCLIGSPEVPIKNHSYIAQVVIKNSDLRDEKLGRQDYQSEKIRFLRTGKLLNNEINYQKSQNFWGFGIPAHTRYPVHLAKWEEFRRNPKAKV